MQANPYQAPNADLSAPAAGVFDESSPFSPSGRFGRLSYLAWATVIGFLAVIVISFVLGGMIAVGSAEGGLAGIVVTQLLVLIPSIFFAIRRLHDFDSSGWWSLLFLVPLVNVIFGLVLLFKAGDEGPNRFAPPRVTRGWEKVVGYIVIGLMVLGLVGMIAAIAIPFLASA